MWEEKKSELEEGKVNVDGAMTQANRTNFARQVCKGRWKHYLHMVAGHGMTSSCVCIGWSEDAGQSCLAERSSS